MYVFNLRNKGYLASFSQEFKLSVLRLVSGNGTELSTYFLLTHVRESKNIYQNERQSSIVLPSYADI